MPHRDQLPACPSCHIALEPQGRRFSCPKCGGALVAASDLELMMNEMSPDDERPLAQRLFKSDHAQRPCPRCASPMAACMMYDVQLDRCAEHGIWFDGAELAGVLQANGDAYAERQPDDREPGIFGNLLWSTIRALFAPWRSKRKLANDIAHTTPDAEHKLD